MLIETKKSKALIEFLKKDLIVNLSILGILENRPNAKIYVDNVENPKGVLVNIGYFNYLYSKDDDFIEDAINSFNKPGEYGFSSIEKSIADKFAEKYKVTWKNPCRIYYYPEKTVDLSVIKHTVRDMDIADVDTVNSFYTFRPEEALEKITESILKRPSSGVYVDGELVCWSLTHVDNSFGIMYTKKEHRHKGYAIESTAYLISQHLNKGLIPYLLIENSNNMSPPLAVKSGFVGADYVDWFGIQV